MNKKYKIITCVLLLILALVVVAACEVNPPELPMYSIHYYCDSLGTIQGELQQTIELCDDATSVTAVPNVGSVFLGWSDGVTTATRHDKRVVSDIIVAALFDYIYFSVEYTADANGSIEGDTTQIIRYGTYTKPVLAVPNEGYMFVGWSDGVTNISRLDEKILSDIKVTALFEKTSKTFAYVYNNATSNNEEESVKIVLEDLDNTVLNVPTKEHFTFEGWYTDVNLRHQFSNSEGNILLGQEIINIPQTCLYAKWKVINKITYRILMVYVTEIKATLETTNGTAVDIDYTMTDIERQICRELSFQFSKYLNEIFDGLVIFEVDNYFTTEPVGADSFGAGAIGNHQTYQLFANQISEVAAMCANYRSVITTFCMDDYDNSLHFVGGSASNKYAFIHFETIIGGLIRNEQPLELLFDLTYPGIEGGWVTFMEFYLHEFTHTVESHYLYGEVYEFHEAFAYYAQVHGSIKDSLTTIEEIIKPYLLNRFIVDGERVGIPYEFWKGDIEITVNYVPNKYDAGRVVIAEDTVESKNECIVRKVQYGGEIKVTAIPNEGYRFVKWSDGVTTATRHDTNIISFLSVTAIFEKIEPAGDTCGFQLNATTAVVSPKFISLQNKYTICIPISSTVLVSQRIIMRCQKRRS